MVEQWILDGYLIRKDNTPESTELLLRGRYQV
jgi:hypothetical protein